MPCTGNQFNSVHGFKSKMETVMKKVIPILIVACFSPLVYAGYENGGVITTYVGDVDCYSGLLEVKNGGAADYIGVENSSHIKVWSTSPLGYNPRGGIWDINLVHQSHLDYYGGWTDEVTVRYNATANLYGGRIDYITSFQNVQWIYGGQPFGQHINIYAKKDWSWILDGNNNKVGITGHWLSDNTLFTIRFLDRTSLGFDPVWANINVIPEPTTMLFVALGGLMLRKRTIN